jgi:hypothetical protein
MKTTSEGGTDRSIAMHLRASCVHSGEVRR